VLTARIMAEMSAVPPHVLAGAWAGLCEWDGAAAVSACKVPFLYVAASAPRADIARLKELCPHMHASQVVGAGHFLQLDVPDQLNPMLDRFMAILASSNGKN
jgi:pimeloyl-ACP methyl ester carboxylesterase